MRIFSVFFFVLTAILKKLCMVAKNKHHIGKEHGPKPWAIGFTGDSSISTRQIIMMKMRQSLGLFS